MSTATEFSFSKRKGFSYLCYKDVDTIATIGQDTLTIRSQTTWFAFWKRPWRETSIPLDRIRSICEKRTWDPWDLVFAGGIAVLSMVTSVFWLLLVLIFIWSAAGWKTELTLEDGTTQRILYSGLHSQPELVNAIQHRLAQKGSAS